MVFPRVRTHSLKNPWSKNKIPDPFIMKRSSLSRLCPKSPKLSQPTQPISKPRPNSISWLQPTDHIAPTLRTVSDFSVFHHCNKYPCTDNERGIQTSGLFDSSKNLQSTPSKATRRLIFIYLSDCRHSAKPFFSALKTKIMTASNQQNARTKKTTSIKIEMV